MFQLSHKMSELKIQNDTSSYHDCIGLHFPEAWRLLSIIMGDMPFSLLLAATQCYITVNNMQQSQKGECTPIFCYFITGCPHYTTLILPISEPIINNFLFPGI